VLLAFSCSSKPIDLRSLAPADSLIYLETNDVAAALQPLIDSSAYVEAAKAKPDLSSLKGVQLAIVVTGFEASEEQVNDANSVLNFKAHFAAIADTHATPPADQRAPMCRPDLDAITDLEIHCLDAGTPADAGPH